MKKSLLFALSLCGSFLLDACGGGASLQTTPPPLTVGLTQSAKIIDMGQSVSLTATVNNDPNHKGVNWTVTCLSGVKACGGMTAASSPSGVADTYNAPSSVSAPETLTVTARSESDSSKSASVKVAVSPALALVNPPPAQPPPGTVGQAFSLDLTQYVQGGTSPFVWSTKSGTLPAGLTLDTATGLVSGTPTAPTTSALQGLVQLHMAGAATAASIVFQGTDSGSPAISVNVPISLTINEQLLAIASPSAMPDGLVGEMYGAWLHCPFSCQPPKGVLLTAVGGARPYRWGWAAVAGSSLPPGLDLSNPGNEFRGSGVVFGVPTAAGTYNASITVTDSESPAAHTSMNYTIRIH
jgi:hypothetical protein